MKKLMVIVCLALGGCNSYIYNGEVAAANKACEPFGGLKGFTASSGNQYGGPWRVTATCKDNTTVEYTLRRGWPTVE